MENIDRAELCEKMAEELRTNGHCKGHYATKDGKMCLYGAGLKSLGFGFDFVDGLERIVGGTPVNKTFRILNDTLGFANEADGFRFNDGVTGSFVNAAGREVFKFDVEGGLNQMSAVDYCIDRAKFWREQG